MPTRNPRTEQEADENRAYKREWAAASRANYPTGVCSACNRTRPIQRNGWCESCVTRWYKAGKPDGGPPSLIPDACRNGHPWPEHLAFKGNGHRYCAACKKERDAATAARRKAERQAARQGRPAPAPCRRYKKRTPPRPVTEAERRARREHKRQYMARWYAELPKGTCASCKENRPIVQKSSGWCKNCTNRWYAAGRPDTGPPTPMSEEGRRQQGRELAAIARQYREIDRAVRDGGWGRFASRDWTVTPELGRWRRRQKTAA